MTASEVSQAWGKWVAELGEWHVFGALTYDPGRARGVPDAYQAKKHVRQLLTRAPKIIGRQVDAAVVALEYQRNGNPHFHPLLRLSGGLQQGDLALLGRWWYDEHGYSRLEAPRGRDAVCAYAAKYLSKDLSRGDVVFWPPRGSLSNHQPGLPR